MIWQITNRMDIFLGSLKTVKLDRPPYWKVKFTENIVLGHTLPWRMLATLYQNAAFNERIIYRVLNEKNGTAEQMRVVTLLPISFMTTQGGKLYK